LILKESEIQNLGDNTENKLPSRLPINVYVANFLLISGHDYLQRHLNRTG